VALIQLGFNPYPYRRFPYFAQKARELSKNAI